MPALDSKSETAQSNHTALAVAFKPPMVTWLENEAKPFGQDLFCFIPSLFHLLGAVPRGITVSPTTVHAAQLTGQ